MPDSSSASKPPPAHADPREHVEVLIVGAGISGIGAAVHLQQQCPGTSYLILEGRAALGGTWDLFRYPGIRSDSDMHTLGFEFKPWRNAKAIADGPAILDYLNETATEHGVAGRIRYRHQVLRATWSSAEALWTLEVRHADTGATLRFSCRVLYMCAGYYSYRKGYTPEFPGIERFRGTVVHPQQWPQDLDYSGKTVVVIGSGATAVTLIPAMANDAGHIVMLQRSPSYVLALPSRDAIANGLRAVLPDRWAYAITRWKNVRLQRFIYRSARRHPQRARTALLWLVRRALGPDFDVATHFTPHYDPWDQRLCVVPDGDLFRALRKGRAEVVTDRIAGFTETGIALASGRALDADIIVTATGLELVVLGEVRFEVDGAPVDFAQTWTYKGMMFSGVPNMICAFGYINASWTLRADLISGFVCRLIRHMLTIGAVKVEPRLRPGDANMPARPWIENFSSGYMQRVMPRLPKQGDREPWLNPQDYGKERESIRALNFDDGALVFSAPSTEPARADTVPAA